jgi:hypothetical protein
MFFLFPLALNLPKGSDSLSFPYNARFVRQKVARTLPLGEWPEVD